MEIPKSVNRVISQNYWVVASENTPADKVDKKGMLQKCYLGVFMIRFENIFGVCEGVWFLQIFKFYINSSKGVCDGV